ncbi:MAG: autotransporter domain-containing protein [Chlamydiae bacterium]|nr:autotransporter domain-containing protein [Chlamydiota bacterium]
MKRLLALACCLPIYALASTTYTWTGSGSDSNMNTSGNWDPNGIPPNSTASQIVFPLSSADFTPNNNVAPNLLFGSMTFNGAYTLTGESFLVPGLFGSSLIFNVTGSTVETVMNISASTAALNVFSTGTTLLGSGSTGGLSGGGVLNIMQGQVNIGGTPTFTGTINIMGTAAGTTVLATGENVLGTTAYIPLQINLTRPGGTTYTALLNLNNYPQVIGGLSGSAGTTVQLGTADLTISSFGSYNTPFYGALVGSGNLILENNASLALLGDLSGFTGDVILSAGASLFTNTLGSIGSFTINGGGGTLQFMLGSSATVNNDITMNDTTTIATNGGTVNYTGTLAGNGTFTKLGLGTLILNGTSNNTGPILIEGGILNVQQNTLPIGPITFQGYGGTLQAGNTLTVAQPVAVSIASTVDTQIFSVTISGPISGGAPLYKTGSGTLFLTNSNNNFTGRVVIQEGTINATPSSLPSAAGGVQQIVFSGTGLGVFQAASGDFSNFLPSIVLQNTGTIDTNSNDMTLNGIVAGSFPLIKVGAGTLTLGNSGNSFTGNIQINNGTLNATPSTITASGSGMPQLIFAGSGQGIFQLGDNFPDFASDIVLQSDGTIDTQQDFDITITGSLIGGGSHTLHKLGGGSINFQGQGYFTGLLNITEGVVYSNSLAAFDTAVQSGATLRGTGTHSGAVTVKNGGNLFPGNSIGILTVGSLVLEPGAITSLEIDGDEASSIDVTGSALLDGLLQIIPDVDAYARQGNYLIVSAEDLTGTFSSISSSQGFTFDVSYQGNQVYLEYTLAIDTEGLSGNELTVANYLNNNAPPSIGYTQLAMLSGNSLQNGLNAVSPARNSFCTYAASQTAFSLHRLVASHIDTSRLAKAPESPDQLANLTADASDTIVASNDHQKEKKWTFWMSGLGEFAHQSSSLQNPSFNFVSEAAVAGFDYRMGDKGLLGFSLDYAHTYYHDAASMGHGNINYYGATLYGTASVWNFYFTPAVSGMFTKTNNQRNIAFSGFSHNALANIYSWQLIPHLEVGYDANFNWGKMIPFTSADLAITWQRSYSEHGASPFNAHQQANNSSMVRSETGLKFFEQWHYSWGCLFLREKLSYVFEKPYGTGTVQASFVGMPGNFTVTAVNQNLNLGAVGMDVGVIIGKDGSVKLDLNYDGEFGSNYWSSDLIFTLTKSF